MRRGILLIALAAVAWGTTGSVTTLLVERAGAHPLVIGAARLWVAGALLVLAAGPRQTLGASGLPALGLGACMTVFQAAYFSSVLLAGIALSALVAICSAPLLIAGLARASLGERLGRGSARALALALLGAALLVASPEAAATRPPGRLVAGVGLALLAGLAYACYAVGAKAALARTAPLPLTAATFGAAAVLATPLALLTGDPWDQVVRGWAGLIYLGAVATAGAYTLYAAGLARVPAGTAGIVTLLEPLTATVLGVAAFGERLGTAGWVGAALLVAGVGLLLRERPG